MPQKGMKRKAPRQMGRPKKRARIGPYKMVVPRKKFGFGHVAVRRFTTLNPLLLTGSDATGAAGQGFDITFKLTDVSGNTEFTALFDQYKIVGVRYRWVIDRDVTTAQTALYQGIFPFLHWVHDYDGNATTTTAALRQYPNYREVQFTQNFTRSRWYYLKPAVQQAMFNTALSASAYSPKWNCFLDTTYSGALHYGVAGRVDQLWAGINLSMEAQYFMVFKSMR